MGAYSRGRLIRGFTVYQEKLHCSTIYIKVSIKAICKHAVSPNTFQRFQSGVAEEGLSLTAESGFLDKISSVQNCRCASIHLVSSVHFKCALDF